MTMMKTNSIELNMPKYAKILNKTVTHCYCIESSMDGIMLEIYYDFPLKIFFPTRSEIYFSRLVQHYSVCVELYIYLSTRLSTMFILKLCIPLEYARWIS